MTLVPFKQVEKMIGGDVFRTQNVGNSRRRPEQIAPDGTADFMGYGGGYTSWT